MTQEERFILFKDLCARLPYHPILNWKFIDNTSKDEELKELSDLYIWWITKAQDCEVKPYLRPMSSMTDEEFSELHGLCPHSTLNKTDTTDWVIGINGSDYGRISRIDEMTVLLDWLNAHHFDYRGLIQKELALEAPKGMYKN